MSTPNATLIEASPEPVVRLRPRGAVWAVLRVHRVALWMWSGFVVLGVAGLTWLHFAGVEVHEARKACAGPVPQGMCSEASAVLPGWDYTSLVDLAAFLIAGVPFAVAAYAGGVLIGRDVETGTVDLVWTQSISPLRWLGVKLGVAALLIAIGTTATAVAFRLVWLSGEKSLLDPWYASDAFNAMGPTVLAYSMFGLAVGALIALLTGRALPALGAAFGVTLLVRLLGDVFRSELWPKVRWEWKGRMPDDAQEFLYEVPGSPGRFPNVPSSDASGATREIMQIHPASHFWPIQYVEAGLVLGMAALAAAVAFWVLRGRLP